MEQVRQAAMDGLFSVPHGGAEIGGVFFGTRTAGCLRILAASPLDCEHALGPAFKLSGNDHKRLAALLEEGFPNGKNWEPLGWYHSRTRSDTLLSDPLSNPLSNLDVEIHNRYFREGWQVALVVRPHAMQPMRGGFFFRAADGSIQADSSYSEFLVLPVPKSVAEQTLEALPCPREPLPPKSPHRSRWWFWWPLLVLGMAAALVVAGNARLRVFAAGRQPSVGLVAQDANGTLQIHWDGLAEPIRLAGAGTLEISDGAERTMVLLDKQRLRGGTVGYTRIGAHVEVRMVLRQNGAKTYEEFTNFIGPSGLSGPDNSEAGLRRQLERQTARTTELEHELAGVGRGACFSVQGRTSVRPLTTSRPGRR
jgi:hypothetical protein